MMMRTPLGACQPQLHSTAKVWRTGYAIGSQRQAVGVSEHGGLRRSSSM